MHTMKRHRILPIAFVLALSLAVFVRAEGPPAEPILRTLPPGVFVLSSTEIPREQTKGFERKFGGKIERLTNSVVRLHGRSIQVNVVTATDESNAKTIHSAFGKFRRYPFFMRKGRFVVEFAKTNDAGLAVKTSYELGVQPKPESVRYQVSAELATVDKADYMACNPLFNHFLAAESDRRSLRKIKDLSKQFHFGRSLVLRNPQLRRGTSYGFEPAAAKLKKNTAAVAYEFDGPPKRHGIPYVRVSSPLKKSFGRETGLFTPSSTASILKNLGDYLRLPQPIWTRRDQFSARSTSSTGC